MPTTITSDRIVRQTKTTYAWTGTANASTSTKALDGVVQRTNLATNPGPNAATTSWAGAGGTANNGLAPAGTTTPQGTGAMRRAWTATMTTSGGGLYSNVPLQPGPVTASVSLRSSRTGIVVRPQIEWYDSSNVRIATAVGDPYTLSADTWQRVSIVTVAPTGTVRGTVTLYNTSGSVFWQSGDTQDAGALLVEASDTLGEYFDGASAGSTAIFYATSSPLVVTGYEAVRQVRNVFNTVLGTQSTVATAFPAGLRSGTLTAVYGTRADAVALDGMLAGTDVLTYTDTDVPDAGMRFLPDGTIKVSPDTTPIDLGGGATGFLWLVEFGYQEVVA